MILEFVFIVHDRFRPLRVMPAGGKLTGRAG